MQKVVSDSHLLVRYSEADAPPEGVVAAHQAILKEKGEVLIGKFGRTISNDKIAIFINQIETGKTTLLYLVKKTDKGYQVHQAKLKAITKQIDKMDLMLVPEYYRKNRFVSVWFRVTSLTKSKTDILKELTIKSSGFTANSTLPKSFAGVFFVRDSTPDDSVGVKVISNSPSVKTPNSLSLFIDSLTKKNID